jgi:hypothetical protein
MKKNHSSHKNSEPQDDLPKQTPEQIRKEAAVLFAELYYRQVMEARRERAKRKDDEDKKIDGQGKTTLE